MTVSGSSPEGNSTGAACPACGTVNPQGAIHCSHCGSPLSAPCPSCGQPNVPEALFCVHCGTRLTAGTPTRSGAATTPPAAANQPQPTKQNRSLPVLLVSCFALAAVACVVAGLVFAIGIYPLINLPHSAAPVFPSALPDTPYIAPTRASTLAPTLTETIPAKHPPAITNIDFPSHIPGDSTDQKGTIAFTDLGGDVIHADFAVIRGNFNPISFNTAGAITGDPKNGVIHFKLWCKGVQNTITLSATLKDKAGFVSPPYQFTFACT